MKEGAEIEEALARHYIVICSGYYDEIPRGHLCRVMKLSYDEEKRSKKEEIAGWMPKEEIKERFPEIKETTDGVCPSCRDKFMQELEEETGE